MPFFCVRMFRGEKITRRPCKGHGWSKRSKEHKNVGQHLTSSALASAAPLLCMRVYYLRLHVPPLGVNITRLQEYMHEVDSTKLGGTRPWSS